MWAFLGLAILVGVAVWGWAEYIEQQRQAREGEVWERIFQARQDLGE